MNLECSKWHPDKMPNLTGGIKIEEEVIKLFNLVAGVAIDMRMEYNQQRKR
jgi:hypothetical protein